MACTLVKSTLGLSASIHVWVDLSGRSIPLKKLLILPAAVGVKQFLLDEGVLISLSQRVFPDKCFQKHEDHKKIWIFPLYVWDSEKNYVFVFQYKYIHLTSCFNRSNSAWIWWRISLKYFSFCWSWFWQLVFDSSIKLVSETRRWVRTWWQVVNIITFGLLAAIHW